MVAAFLNNPKIIELKMTEKPEPKAGEVRIRLKQIGICGSDVHLFQGHRPLNYPHIIGHEGLGVIDKIGANVDGREVGERVVIEPNIPCQKCRYCQSGRGNICINKRVIGVNEAGCFAEYICLPSSFAWKVPPSVSDADAVTIEPTAVAYHALMSSQAKAGDTIAVIGLGAIGLLVAHVALRLGYKVFVTEINENKVKLVEKQGAIPLCPKGTIEEQTAVLEKTWLESEVCAVFECAGSRITTTMTAAAAPRGADIVMLGLSEKPAEFVPLKIVREEILMLPSIIYNHPFDFKRVLQLIVSKTIEPSFIISSQADLKDLQTALELASAGNESKIVVNV
jgi:L-iditol 2-dehydrogenase